MNKKRIFILLVLFVLVGIAIGYSFGFSQGVSFAVSIGLNFVDIDINEDMLSKALIQYQDSINSCFFLGGDNASVFYE